MASAAFWTSLTALDPLAAIVLFVRPNTGVVATGSIIVADVMHNLWITARLALPHRSIAAMTIDPLVVSQVAFLLFVAVTSRIAWTARQQGSERALS